MSSTEALTTGDAARLLTRLNTAADALRTLCPIKTYTNYLNGDQVQGRDLSALTDEQVVRLSRIDRLLVDCFLIKHGNTGYSGPSPLPPRKARTLRSLIQKAEALGITC